MLTFHRQMLPLVQQGAKTETRRLWPDGPQVEPHSVHAVADAQGTTGYGHVHVTAVYEQRLSKLTEEDARAEGFASRAEFADYFRRCYPQWKGKDTTVWVVEFWYDRSG